MSTKSVWRRDIIPARYRYIWGSFLTLVLVGILYTVSLPFLFLASARLGLRAFDYILVAAGLAGLLHFTIAGLIRGLKVRAIIPSVQVFAFTSVLPYLYIVWLAVEARFLGKAFLSPIGITVLYLLTVLPELLVVATLASLKKKSKVLTAVFALLAALAAFEVWPMRTSYVSAGHGFMSRFDDTAAMKPFGKLDRETEFIRSENTLSILTATSAQLPGEKLTPVVLGRAPLEGDIDILKADISAFHMWEDLVAQLETYEVSLDTTLDSDGDGLSDFLEAQLLSDARLRDTDGDGYTDEKDSDPLNPLILSHHAGINAAILECLADHFSLPFLLVENRFREGRGEIANFSRHALLLENDQARKWGLVFGYALDEVLWPATYDPLLNDVDRLALYVQIGRIRISPSRRIALAEVIHRDCGLVLLLARLRGEWRVIVVNLLWIPM